MCGPAALVPLTIASTVVSAGSQIYSGMAANSQAKYEAAVAQQNRNMELAARGDAVERGQIDQLQHWRKVSQMYGSQVAAQAASGVDVGFGSSGDLLGDVMLIGGEDSRTIDRNTLKEIRGYEVNAANYTMQGRAAKQRGTGALVGSVLSAGGTLLSGATQVSKFRSNFGG